MPTWQLPEPTVARLYRSAGAERWDVPMASFTAALERSVRKAFVQPPAGPELERHAASLHLQDLALACACAEGHERAWEHFIHEHRPALYKAADVLDPAGGARDLADSLYAELFGLNEKDGRRRSLLEYFHGRSSLSTWLRAVLAQRHVDRVRGGRRLEPLPEEGALPVRQQPSAPPATYLDLMRDAVSAAVARLSPRDRLRLTWYYAQELTLAEIGRALKEHEATVSRNLARARRDIRADVERQLRDERHMAPAQVEDCFAAVVEDVGSLDVADLLSTSSLQDTTAEAGTRKKKPSERSKERTEGASA